MICSKDSDELSRLVNIRRDLHAHPELAFEEFRTSSIVAQILEEAGFSVTTQIAGTGVVGTLQNGTSRKSIGLRADMDALPIQETTNLAYRSRYADKMHACGHDGHTAMLLGAARRIAKEKDFDGTVHLIFQPAEEDIGGAEAMIKEYLFSRFPCDAVYALHNFPGFEQNQVMVRKGAFMAGVDFATVKVKGVGGHGAMPHLTIDPVVIASQIVVSLQSIVSRTIDPLDSVVITVGAFNAGKTCAIIPSEATLEIGIRFFKPETGRDLEEKICRLIQSQAASFGADAEVNYHRGYPATISTDNETQLVRKAAERVASVSGVKKLENPFCASEDFSFMLQERPGCYFGLGAGDEPDRANLHDARYDFNDACIPAGVDVWSQLVKTQLPN